MCVITLRSTLVMKVTVGLAVVSLPVYMYM